MPPPSRRPEPRRSRLAWLKTYGPGYQTKANMLLRHAMNSIKSRPGKKSKSA